MNSNIPSPAWIKQIFNLPPLHSAKLHYVPRNPPAKKTLMFLSATNLDFMHCDMVNDSMKGLAYLASENLERFTMREIVNSTSNDSNN